MHTEGRIQSGATMHALDPGLSYSDKVPQYRRRFIMILNAEGRDSESKIGFFVGGLAL